jgi:hypothetical protein
VPSKTRYPSPGHWGIAVVPLIVILRLSLPGQTSISPASQTNSYINPGLLPAPARPVLSALGSRLARPGNERITLSGKITDKATTANARIVWEVPGRFRFDRDDQPGSALIFDDVKGPNKAFSPSEADTLESLFEDGSETFLYALQRGSSFRLLGGWFRADDGKAANYKGPWFDVYEFVTASSTQPGAPKRNKIFLVDSQTKLLAKVEYWSSPSVRITTEFSQWTKSQGESFPFKIVRKENGIPVLTIDVVSANTSPAGSDGVFPGH